MSNDERIQTCRSLAQRAERLATDDVPRRDAYLAIAKGWTALAEDIELYGS